MPRAFGIAVWVVIWLLGFATAGTPARAQPVDLLLVLAVDVSRSIDDDRFHLQREGYARALVDPRVLRAIRSGPLGRIAILYFEWSGEGFQKTLVDWTVVGDGESAGVAADILTSAPRPFANRTAIGQAIEYAMAQFPRSPFTAARRVIDVSGDGTNTNGREPGPIRDEAAAQGITINGLAILSAEPLAWNPQHTHPPGGLENYYRDHVAGGPGAFVLVANGFDSFAYAIVGKLVKEIAEAEGR
ncbi:MAG: DUF1194 domain-containing protein [Rhodospirillales bacterium]|nr:DUF1194 domain-containing protein [Rhodospirillales bacterium]